MSQRDIITADDPNADLCTSIEGVDHDYRPWTEPMRPSNPRPRTYLRCVWCHVVSCGDYGEDDPCIEPYHHSPKPHRTRSGLTWPIGQPRPCTVMSWCTQPAGHRGLCSR